MPSSDLPPGVVRVERLSYRGKHYELPIFDAEDPVLIHPRSGGAAVPDPSTSLILAGIHAKFDFAEFARPRTPVSLGVLEPEAVAVFARAGAVRILDMPVKMPDLEEVRIPRALAQFAPTVQRIVDYEHQVNPHHAEYFAYLTIDQRWVAPGSLHREAPCHVDGFQGARWSPKCRTNHSYTVSDLLPTAYYIQPFALERLDETQHDFFWEMNAIVADTNEAHRWQPREAELTLMDCYTVHRGVENDTSEPVFRTWLRLSFEERRRVFDRLGNAHNPLFDYEWEMVERDIEQLGLVAFRPDGDPSHHVFPWQDLEGRPLPSGAAKTKPRLRRAHPDLPSSR